MADTKISALPASTTPLAGTEVLPIVQSSTTKQVSVSNLTAGRSVSVADLAVSANNIVPGTAAKGVNFTANTPAAGMASQLLNWYEEGTWTPVLTFATPGNLSITFSIQLGTYTRVGNRVVVNYNITTSAFSFTTASGSLQITGLPFTSKNLSTNLCWGSVSWGGITKAGYTQITPRLPVNSTTIDFVASGTGLAINLVSATDTPTGGQMYIHGFLIYEV